MTLVLKMPPPCGVESHVRCYKEIATRIPKDATPLRGGVSRWLLQKKLRRELLKMPPPCGVESHAGCYKESPSRTLLKDATPSRGGASRSLLQRESFENSAKGCHPLAWWSLTLVATGFKALDLQSLRL